MSGMTSRHRLFLQGLMSRRCGKEIDLIQLLKSCKQNDGQENVTAKNLGEVINTINANIRPIHMEIKKGINEITGEVHYALVNTCETSVARLSSDYSVNELEFFKKIVEALVTDLSHNGEISSILVLNSVDKLEKKFSKREAQDLIEKFIGDQWLVKTNQGGISLHVRALIELEHYIKEMFPDDAVICLMCKQLVLKGHECKHCDAKLHKHCAVRITNHKNAKCPKCKKEWP